MQASLMSALLLLAYVLNLQPIHCWLAGEWLGTDHLQRTRLRPELSWRQRLPQLRVQANPTIENNVISHIVSNTYEFTLPPVQLRRGLVYKGEAARLRRVVNALLKGEAVKVGVVGGSVSWGHGSSRRGQTDWFSVLAKWMISAFPRANLTARNGCTPGVPTPYMIMCLDLSVDPDVDLVFMEYTLNDAHSLDSPAEEGRLLGNPIVRDAERLVRRVLALPRRPAVVLLHTPPVGIANYPVGHPKNPLRMPAREFYMTSEDIQGAISQYYDVQYLSLRTAVYRLATHKLQPGFLWEDMFADHHPGDHGHKIMADLAVHLVQQVALDLIVEPYGSADQEVVDEPLPPPMYAGNIPPNSTMCKAGEGFRSLVVSAQGFEYVNEGTDEKPKPGFVATAPGSRLRLRVDTDRTALDGTDPGASVFVSLHYLRSYQHMGTARMSCVAGCQCPPNTVDAHGEQHVSQVVLAQLVVTQARQCDIEVEVLRETRSVEHKFKVSGVVVAERPGRADFKDGEVFGLRQHLDEEGGVEQLTLTTSRDGKAASAG